MHIYIYMVSIYIYIYNWKEGVQIKDKCTISKNGIFDVIFKEDSETCTCVTPVVCVTR
jgi:hypothetical protein